MMLRQFITHSVLALSCSLPTLVWAHSPLMECWQSQGIITCQTGWTDGSNATNYLVGLYDYDDQLIAEARTDQNSLVSFEVPEGDYYLYYDPAHESTIEIDGQDIPERG